MRAIEAYASATSVSPGERIGFHISLLESRDQQFRIEIVRQGLRDGVLLDDRGQAGRFGVPADAPENGCRWPAAYSLQVTDSFQSGVYMARLTESGGARVEVPFVVRARSPGSHSRILFQIAVNTWQAYNNWGGRSLYNYHSRNGVPATQVSFNRPGIEEQASDLGHSDSRFDSFEKRFVKWLELNGFEVEYCTNIDIHRDPRFLDNYRLLLSVGHDEYWSNEMRNTVERFVANGGNFAIFGGNICWWQVRFSQDLRTMISFKEQAALDPLNGVDNIRVTTNWYAAPVDRPTNTMTGVDFRGGAYWDEGQRPAVPFVVLYPNHWVFETALAGNTFGADEGIVGYETDAAALDHYDPARHPRATGADGTPRNFVPLAIADCTNWAASGGQSGRATMGIFRNNGTVFTTATTDWHKGLSIEGGWTPVDQITKNVLRRLSCACAPVPELTNAGFEQYDIDGRPIAWKVEGAGTAGPGTVDIGHTPLLIDAVRGMTWVSQGPLWIEAGNVYTAGCWARASKPGATLRLQSMATWKDFAIATHPGDGAWHYLLATGTPDAAETPVFPARVKLQVREGLARFDAVCFSTIPPHP